MAYLWVAIGGALGSMARFWVDGLISAMKAGTLFPLGTLLINITGSFLIGIFGALTAPPHGGLYRVTIIQLVMVGICGGYTTFSSFSLQTLNLMRDGQWLYAAGNVLGSVIFCMVAVWLGWLTGIWFNSLKGL